MYDFRSCGQIRREFAVWETFKTFMQVIKKQRNAFRSLMSSISPVEYPQTSQPRGSVASLFKILGGMPANMVNHAYLGSGSGFGSGKRCLFFIVYSFDFLNLSLCAFIIFIITKSNYRVCLKKCNEGGLLTIKFRVVF